jgi:uncharacterized caspase-like protein
MRRFLGCVATLIAVLSFGLPPGLKAEPAEKRIALVIGNAAYQAGELPTSANDAGLIAQTLQAAGFDVAGARDLDQDSLRRAFRDFLEKASSSGPDTVAFVYLGGYGLQLEGENYFLPVDAKIGSAAAVAAEAVRISDYTRPLAALGLKAGIFVLDAARRTPFPISGEPLAGGLALVEPGPGMLVAFNAAPGTVAPEQNGPYGAYAQALAEMMREGGLPLPDVFERVRLRVNDTTRGAQIPWNASRLETSFVFLERSPDAPPGVTATEQSATMRARPLAELGASDAYAAALDRDTLQAYEEFLADYPDDPMARRVHAIVAARREAMIWQQTRLADTPQAYWSYLRRYPSGPHSGDAHRRLALRAMAFEPPASFAEIDYDVPPPPPEEQAYVDQPALAFDDADFAPPPPLPIYFLPPPPPDFIVLSPPVPPDEDFALPVPVFVPIPIWCHPPLYLAPPPANVIFSNIHNTVIVNHVTREVTIKDHNGAIVISDHAGDRNPRLALAPALPPSIAAKVALGPSHSSTHNASPLSAFAHGGSMPNTSRPPLGQSLPGANGHPLPPLPGGSHGAPTALSAPANSMHGPAPARVLPPSPSNAPNAATWPARPQLPQLAARPPMQWPTTPSPAPNGPRMFPPAAAVRPAAPLTVRPAPPVQRPSIVPPAYRPAPPPVAAIRPPSPPAYRPPQPPAIHAALPATAHFAAPPAVHAAPPAVHAAPAPLPAAHPPSAPARRH